VQRDSLNQDLKTNSTHSSNNTHTDFNYEKNVEIEGSKLNNKPMKNVTFLLSSDGKISLKTNNNNVDICKNLNTYVHL